MDESESTLGARHLALHEALLAEVEHMLVAAVALAFDEARLACQRLGAAIDTHRAAEEQALGVLAAEPALPRGAGRELVVAEHDKLDELIGRADETLRALAELGPDTDRRRALVRHLEPLMRVRSLLEHHTQREVELVYPHLERHLHAGPRGDLIASIDELIVGLSRMSSNT